MRQCPFRGCTKVVPPDKFGCYRHWMALTPQQKRTIHAAYADYKSGTIDLDRLREIQRGVLDANQGAAR